MRLIICTLFNLLFEKKIMALLHSLGTISGQSRNVVMHVVLSNYVSYSFGFRAQSSARQTYYFVPNYYMYRKTIFVDLPIANRIYKNRFCYRIITFRPRYIYRRPGITCCVETERPIISITVPADGQSGSSDAIDSRAVSSE